MSNVDLNDFALLSDMYRSRIESSISEHPRKIYH